MKIFASEFFLKQYK